MKITMILKKLSEISIGKHFSISICIVPVLFFAVKGQYLSLLLTAYLCAALHELSHILCAWLLGVKISKVSIYPFGISARLGCDYIKSCEKEFAIAFAGPFMSLVLFWLFSFMQDFFESPLLKAAADSNLALCAINLVPALPLDGGRMLKAMLTSKYGILRAYNFMQRISRFFVIVLAALGIVIFFICDFNFSLVLISAFLFQSLAFEQNSLLITNLKEILAERQKPDTSAILRTKAICFKESQSASLILKVLSYDCFYIVHVLDRDFSVSKTLSEVQVVDAISKNGMRLRFKDIKG